MRALSTIVLSASSLALAASISCAAPELGELPARCSDGVCPEGYACIHGVCARPGTPIPITVASLTQLYGEDLRVVPQGSTALVTWQTYAYSETGQRFVGARVGADGSVSQEMTLVSSFAADAESNEPFYDILGTPDGDLLIAVSAPPLLGDASPEPRLIVYRATLPPEGQEASGVQFGAAWPEERHMPTIGYGAVSRPKLLLRGGLVQLGYFQTRRDEAQEKTIGELFVVNMNEDGEPAFSEPVAYPARAGLPVAVSVEAAFEGSTGTWWVLDDERPSVLLFTTDGIPIEKGLERLAVAGTVTGSSLFYIRPSARAGDKLPSGPVSGGAALHRADHAVGSGPPQGEVLPSVVGELPAMRDTPRPAWVDRSGKAPIVVTPGAELGAGTLGVFTVDVATGKATEAARIERFATSDIVGVAATVVGGNLFVVWAETAETTTIRAAVIPEP